MKTVSWGKLRKFSDSRGWFAELFRQEWVGIQYVQDNISVSEFGAVRGLHLQTAHPQAKVVVVISGEIFDVWVDLRTGSPNFKKAEYRRMSALDWVYIPAGFAHGFQALDRNTTVIYKCSDYYHPEDESGIVWNDPDLHIPWPRTAILSEKDQKLPSLKDAYTYTELK